MSTETIQHYEINAGTLTDRYESAQVAELQQVTPG